MAFETAALVATTSAITPSFAPRSSHVPAPSADRQVISLLRLAARLEAPLQLRQLDFDSNLYRPLQKVHFFN